MWSFTIRPQKPKCVKQSQQPITPLNPSKFLMPVLPYGPNNQLRGFRETIILAIKLNRTVVMPPFYKHRSDPSPGEISTGLGKIVL